MKNNLSKKKIILSVIICLALLFGIWRFSPHALTGITPSGTDTSLMLGCSATITGIDNGEPVIDYYTLKSLPKDSDIYGTVIDILKASGYRQDFRNLLPWPVTSVGSDRQYGGRSVTVWFSADSRYEGCYLTLSGRQVIVDSSGNTGMKIYHLTNPDILDQLADYIQAHGVKS